MVIAIIGSIEATQVQVEIANEIVLNNPGANINICCNPGLEESCLSIGKNFTTGFAPFNSFNPDVQAKCNRVFYYATINAELRFNANSIVETLHHNPSSLNSRTLPIIARIYPCIEEADIVYVFPAGVKYGACGMAIKIAKYIGKKLIVVNEIGNKSQIN